MEENLLNILGLTVGIVMIKHILETTEQYIFGLQV